MVYIIKCVDVILFSWAKGDKSEIITYRYIRLHLVEWPEPRVGRSENLDIAHTRRRLYYAYNRTLSDHH